MPKQRRQLMSAKGIFARLVFWRY